MKREFKVEADVGAPQVAYRETITSAQMLIILIKNNLEVLDNLLELK